MSRRFALFFIGALSLVVFMSTVLFYKANKDRFKAPLHSNTNNDNNNRPYKQQQQLQPTKQLANKNSGSDRSDRTKPPVRDQHPPAYNNDNNEWRQQQITDEHDEHVNNNNGGGDEDLFGGDEDEHASNTDTNNSEIEDMNSRKGRTANHNPIHDEDTTATEREVSGTSGSSSIDTYCTNTVSGKHYITDSRGYLCPIEQVNPFTQCCDQVSPAKDRYVCGATDPRTLVPFCKPEYDCCSNYEHCVSCCMHPDNRELVRNQLIKYQSTSNPLYSNVQTAFQFCSIRCRTSSKSLHHENQYKSRYKHCYGNGEAPTATSG